MVSEPLQVRLRGTPRGLLRLAQPHLRKKKALHTTTHRHTLSRSPTWANTFALLKHHGYELGFGSRSGFEWKLWYVTWAHPLCAYLTGSL